MFLPNSIPPLPLDATIPRLSRAKCEKLIEMFCQGGEFELAQKLAAYADALPKNA